MGQHLAIINACCEVASDDEENAKLEVPSIKKVNRIQAQKSFFVERAKKS